MAWILGSAWHHGLVPDNTEAIPSVTLTTAAVAEMLNLSTASVRSWANTGRIPAYRVGRSWIMLSTELRVWLESTSTRPEPYRERADDFLAGLPPLLTKCDVARLLHVSVPTVGDLLAAKAISHLDLETTTRIPLSDLRQFLAKIRNNAPGALGDGSSSNPSVR